MMARRLVCLSWLLLCGSLLPANAADFGSLKTHWQLSRPDGPGPFPVILMLSGCSGFDLPRANYNETQHALTNLGFLTVRVDSLAARQAGRCDRGLVTRAHQVTDVKTVVDQLLKRDDVQQNAFTVLGWSWGGGGALAVAVNGTVVQRAIAYYPACPYVPVAALKMPTLVLFGEADNVVSLVHCKPLFERSAEHLTLKTYAGAHHGFNNPKFNPPIHYRFGTLAYDKQADAAAWQELVAFLRAN